MRKGPLFVVVGGGASSAGVARASCSFEKRRREARSACWLAHRDAVRVLVADARGLCLAPLCVVVVAFSRLGGERKGEGERFSLCVSFRHAFFVACARPMDRPVRCGSEQAMPADSPRGCSSLNDLTIFPREGALFRRRASCFCCLSALSQGTERGIVGAATQRERARKRAFVRKEPACG